MGVRKFLPEYTITGDRPVAEVAALSRADSNRGEFWPRYLLQHSVHVLGLAIRLMVIKREFAMVSSYNFQPRFVTLIDILSAFVCHNGSHAA